MSWVTRAFCIYVIDAHLYRYVQPASIDIPVSGAVHLVKEKILPFQQSVASLLPSITVEKRALVDDVVLLKGQTYLMYCGRVSLPPNCRGSLSPKSSIGRVDIMVRGVLDGCGLYDSIPAGSGTREL